jgi:1-acyl-sn-glycerol-3-phosphate acyltransferase
MPGDRLRLQQILKPVIGALFRMLSRIRVLGLENLPPSPPYIIFSNHISWFDPFLVGAWVPAPVHFMTMEGLLKFPPLGWILKRVGAFPVRRGTLDRRAIEDAMAILENGGVVFIFPEGGIERLRKGEKPRPGVSLIAQRTNVPLVPVGIHGGRDLYNPFKLLTRRVKITIRVGKPFTVASIAELEGKKMRTMVMERITKEMCELSAE